jgi:hypothetical protein
VNVVTANDGVRKTGVCVCCGIDGKLRDGAALLFTVAFTWLWNGWEGVGVSRQSQGESWIGADLGGRREHVSFAADL